MAYPISDVTRRIVYSGSAGTGPYSFTFEVLANTDIQVYKNTTLLTLTTNYTVTINSNGTGSVTLVSAATSSDTITIVGDRAIQRATDFVTGGDLFANTLNDEFDSLVIFAQQVDEKADRGLKAPVTDPTDVNMVLPVKATRKGTVLAFNETTGNPEAGPSIGSVTTVSAQSANINTVATNIASVNTVAGNNTNINTVAGISSNVTTVAGISANVTSVAGNSSNINTVAGNNANVTAVGTISGNVTTVAGISANVTTVAGISSNVTTVAGVSAAVTTNATNISSINTNATNIVAIQNASTNATNAAASAVAAGNAQTAAEAARDATLTAYDNFDDRYLGSKTSNPTVDNDGNALVAGSLYFNSVSGSMQVYTGSAWVAAYVSGSGYLASANNLSDVASTSSARTNLGLGTAATMTGPSGTIVGTSDSQTLTNKTLTAPTLASANITTALTLTGAAGTAGQALTSQGSGAAPTWTTIGASAATPTALGTVYGKTDTSSLAFVGYQAGNSVSTSNGTTAVGYQAGYSNSTASQVSFFGYLSGYSVTGEYNAGFGAYSLNATTSGVNNTAMGTLSLRSNQTGSNNVAVGMQAAYANTSGGNTAVGATAFYTNTSGNNATCVGYQAGYNNTTDTELTAFGYRAAFSNTTGSGGGRTTALGVQALEGNTTGYNNTAVGWRALKSVTTGTANTAMGQQAGTNCTGNENVYIGNQCNTEATSGGGNTGINAGYGGSRIFSLTTESNRFIAGHNGVSNAYVQVAWTVTSDARDKTDIVAAPYGLDFVTELRPIQYRWDKRSKYANGQPNGTHKEDKKVLGFLAQEVIELEKKYGAVEKDLLIADDEEVGMLKVTETKMIPILVKAIQELKAELDQLKAKVA